MKYRWRRMIAAGAIVALAYAGIAAASSEPQMESDAVKFYLRHMPRSVLK